MSPGSLPIKGRFELGPRRRRKDLDARKEKDSINRAILPTTLVVMTARIRIGGADPLLSSKESFDDFSKSKSVGSIVSAMAQVSITTDENSGQRVQPLTGHKFFLLFLFLLAYLALYPYMGDTGPRYFAFRVVSAAVTLMCVYAVSFRKGLIVVALILAVPSILAHTIVFRPRMLPASVFNLILSFAFDAFVI